MEIKCLNFIWITMKEKIVVCFAMEARETIQPLLDQGWSVVSVTATEGKPPKTEPGWSSTYEGPQGEVIFILRKV